MNYFTNYFMRIYRVRYFWFHLVRWDLKYKFRRSRIGILWTLLQPLLLTLMMTMVFGVVFKLPLGEYAPYILSGMLVWDVILGSIIYGANAFLSGESYMRQFAHPVAIYSLRASLVVICTFLMALLSLVFWILFTKPQNLPIAFLSLPFTIVLFFFLSWPVATIASHINIRYRDYPYVMGLVMQLLWYISPVFFQGNMFSSNIILKSLFNYNPITHVLLLIRDPFLYGKIPSVTTYVYVFIMAVLLCILAYNFNKKHESSVIFYF